MLNSHQRSPSSKMAATEPAPVTTMEQDKVLAEEARGGKGYSKGGSTDSKEVSPAQTMEKDAGPKAMSKSARKRANKKARDAVHEEAPTKMEPAGPLTIECKLEGDNVDVTFWSLAGEESGHCTLPADATLQCLVDKVLPKGWMCKFFSGEKEIPTTETARDHSTLIMRASELPDEKTMGRIRSLTKQDDLQNAEVLRLGGTRYGDDGVTKVAKALQHMPNVKNLTLFDVDMGDQGAIAIAGALGNVPHLQHLDLSRNHIATRGAAAIAGALTKVPNLDTLYINGNNMPFPGKEDLKRAWKGEIATGHGQKGLLL